MQDKIQKTLLKGNLLELDQDDRAKFKELLQDGEFFVFYLALALIGSTTLGFHIDLCETISLEKKSESLRQEIEAKIKNDPFISNIDQICYLRSGNRLINERMGIDAQVSTIMSYIKGIKEGGYTNLFLSLALNFPKGYSDNRTNSFDYLMYCGYDINSKGSSGNSALHNAAWKNNKLVLKKLLQYPSLDLNWKNKGGYTALNLAIIEYNFNIYDPSIEFVQLLVEAESERTNTDILTVVQNAFNRQTMLLNIATINLNAKSIVRKFIYKYDGISLYSAVVKNNIEVVKKLLRYPYIDLNMHQQDPNVMYTSYCTPLGLAIQWHHLEIAEILLNHQKVDPCIPFDNNSIGKTPNYSYKTNLQYASCYAHPEIFKLFVKHPKVIKHEMKSAGKALYILATDVRGKYPYSTEKAKALFECPKAQISQDEYLEAFYRMCDNSNTSLSAFPEFAKVFIRNPKFDITRKNREGSTPLHIILQKYIIYMRVEDELIEICKEFLKRENIDLSIKDNKGRTPLRIAIEGERVDNNTEIIQLLFEFQSRRCNTDVRTLLKAELSAQYTIEQEGWFGYKTVKLPAINTTPGNIIAKFKYSDAEINAILVQITKTGAHSISK